MTRTNERRITTLFTVLAMLALHLAPAQAQDESSVPAQPTGLSAETFHDHVDLSWDDPGDETITGYEILRRDKDVHEEGTFGTVKADTGTADTAYTDDTVAAGTSYTYRIKAINGAGPGERSRWFHIDTPAAP